MKHQFAKCALAAVLLFGTGCSWFFQSALNGAADNAGNRAGNAAVDSTLGQPKQASYGPQGGAVNVAYNGGQQGGMSAASMPPAAMNLYLGQMFSMAFSPGGYAVTEAVYRPGEYTRWEISHQSKDATLERAHLFDDANGNQWWRVKWVAENKPMIVEGLLNPAQNRFVRMRAQFPGDAAPQELPVDDQSYYRPPQHLSKESIQGATVGSETVTVPAGSFTAQHVVYGQMGMSQEWWIDAKVPGGTVRQLTKSDQGIASEMRLMAYGSDAKSELGAK